MDNPSKLELWREKGLTLRDRFKQPPVVQRDEVSQQQINDTIERGDITQELRLRFYPSIDLSMEISNMYAGSIQTTLDELEELLYEMGYRNNPTAYVEYTDQLGPDDGSYAKHTIVEGQEFPYLGIGRPFGIVTWWNRLKQQVHVTTFLDDEEDMIHLFAHKEASAWLQPARHLTVSTGDGDEGVREFRRDWKDTYESELTQTLDL